MFEEEMKAKTNTKLQGEGTYLNMIRDDPKVRCVLKIKEKQETN